jgi:hypothetical protein
MEGWVCEYPALKFFRTNEPEVQYSYFLDSN